ncbi:MAG: transglutaminase-like domain-containing protein [Candidatus Diapherotrites archaeon]
MKKLVFGIMLLAIVVTIFISGCVQEKVTPAEINECEVLEDCPNELCLAKDCVNYECSYSEITLCCGNEICEISESYPECPECPNCNDNDECTRDSFDYERQKCVNELMVPCCGDGICETEETYLIVETYSTCPQDCQNPKEVLEEIIPEIKDYPKLEEVFIDLYVPFKFVTMVGFNYSECKSGFFTEEEIEFMKLFLEIYKENPNLKDYPRDVLYYFASWSSGDTTYYDFNFFSDTLREKALSLKGGNDLSTAENIYDFVNEYITGTERISEYTSARSLDEVETIWQYKTGQCEEKTYLITALLRSIGIPTRIVDSAQASHKWAEIYSNNQWIPIPSTGALDHDKDKKVDFQEDMVLDVAITYDLSKTQLLECVALTSAPKSFIGYKYTAKFTEALLTLAEDNEFKNTTLDYISKWKATRIWKEREEFGRIAFENSVAAIFGEKKPVYTWLDVDVPFGVTSASEQNIANLFPENEIVIIGLESHYKMESTSSFFRELLELNKKIDVIVIKDDFSGAVLLDSNDINQLSKIRDNFKQNSELSSVLDLFVEALKNIEEGELSETDFSLPAVGYNTFLSSVWTIREEGFEYRPYIVGSEEIKGILFIFKTDISNENFRYIKFVNEKGETVLEPKSDGYYESCVELKILFNQTLDIRKEGDYIIIQGEMHLEE